MKQIEQKEKHNPSSSILRIVLWAVVGSLITNYFRFKFSWNLILVLTAIFFVLLFLWFLLRDESE